MINWEKNTNMQNLNCMFYLLQKLRVFSFFLGLDGGESFTPGQDRGKICKVLFLKILEHFSVIIWRWGL